MANGDMHTTETNDLGLPMADYGIGSEFTLRTESSEKQILELNNYSSVYDLEVGD
jgi:hypothetical protein